MMVHASVIMSTCVRKGVEDLRMLLAAPGQTGRLAAHRPRIPLRDVCPGGIGDGMYILYQLLVLLGRSPVLEEFNHLKTIDLAISNDQVWQQVCAHLGWRFVPTV